MGQNSICKTNQNYLDRFENKHELSIFSSWGLKQYNHQCAVITHSFLVFRHMMKAVTAAFMKKVVSSAKRRSFRRAFQVLLMKKSFPCKYLGIR